MTEFKELETITESLPWKASTFGLGEHQQNVVLDANCGLVATTLEFDSDDPVNARFIARVCNCHDELLAALREMLVLYADHAQYDDSEEQWEVKGIESARAAIAKATEEN